MVACLLLLLTLLPLSCAQPGFVSIQCCAPSNTTDRDTKITWTSDNYLLNNAGRCRKVTVPSSIASLFYRRARVFNTHHRTRWCYNLPVVHGQVYLVRATFLYGPTLRSLSETYFNLLIGSTSISRVNSSLNSLEVEGIFAATANHTNVCLLRGKGNAYISMLELRPLNDAIYLDGNSSTVLKLVTRVDLGNNNYFYRYPVDPADRQWEIQANLKESSVLRSSDISLQFNSSIPLEVLQTAAVDAEQLGFFHTNLDTSHDDYLIILYFLELNTDVRTGQRVFDIYVNGDKKYEKVDILENGNTSKIRELSMRVKSNGYLNISLVKFSNATKYGPICNAYEIFQAHPRAAETVEGDANAMEELRDKLVGENPGNGIFKKWHGDPCMPYPWEGLACEERNGSLVITMLDLSSKTLRGPFPTIISNLRELKELHAQNNDFSGSIPKSFASLHRLSKLSIKCNQQLNSELPPGLSDRTNFTVVSGSCGQDSSQTQTPQRTIYFIGSIAGGSVAFTVVLGMIFTCFYKRARRPGRRDNMVIKNAVFSGTSFPDLPMNPVVQSFSLQYIEKSTCHYKTLIGEGGFGPVFRGTLPHGQEVAVKVRSATSTQGTREFDNEVNLLSNIRHENLVPLLGYCCENDQQILVYPFMSNGSLQDRLYGEASKRKALDWPTRLSIALGAARGLMYLHAFDGRCIIHRDVKSSNILLDDSMCGKVADFGFSKYAPQEGDSGASLEVRGTAGYLDPEYYSTQQLSTKSDVFSFGVVLLEIITGREPLNIHRPRNEWSLLEWAKPFIRESRIEEIVDPNIKGGYHAEAMWRVVEAALACIEPFSTHRPSMVDIARELEDALIIENNASEYMRSIDSIGGSNRFVSVERKATVPTPAPAEPSSCQVMAALQPR